MLYIAQMFLVGLFLCSGVVVSEKTPFVIFGMAKVKCVKISALLSGLKLEADLENGQASATYRQKVRGTVTSGFFTLATLVKFLFW